MSQVTLEFDVSLDPPQTMQTIGLDAINDKDRLHPAD